MGEGRCSTLSRDIVSEANRSNSPKPLNMIKRGPTTLKYLSSVYMPKMIIYEYVSMK